MKLKEYIRKNNRPLGQLETLFLVTVALSAVAVLASLTEACMQGARVPAFFVGLLAFVLCLFNQDRQFWKVFRRLPHHDSFNPIRSLAETILHMAARSGVDKIVFGEPPSPFEVEPPPPARSLQDQVTSGTITETEKQELEHLLQREDKTPDGVAELIEATDPFRASPVMEVPVWHRFNGKWQRGAPISLRILNAVVDEFASRSATDVCVKMGGQVTHRVRYTVDMETKFCYSITIEDVQAVGPEAACGTTSPRSP